VVINLLQPEDFQLTELECNEPEALESQSKAQKTGF